MQDQFIGRSANILAERRKRKGAPAYGPDFLHGDRHPGGLRRPGLRPGAAPLHHHVSSPRGDHGGQPFETGKFSLEFGILTTNKKSPNQKIEDCRQYDTKKDWSFHLSDQELLTQFEEDAKIQETIIAQAQKYDYPTIDVCKQREEKLEKVYQKIKKNLS